MIVVDAGRQRYAGVDELAAGLGSVAAEKRPGLPDLLLGKSGQL